MNDKELKEFRKGLKEGDKVFDSIYFRTLKFIGIASYQKCFLADEEDGEPTLAQFSNAYPNEEIYIIHRKAEINKQIKALEKERDEL